MRNMRNLRKVRRIYDNVYSMNENMMVSERRALIQGFEDGLNEGWFSNVMGKAGKFAKSVKDGVKNAYNTGKKLAGEVIDNVKAFINGIVDDIKRKYKDARKVIIDNYNEYKEKIKNAYDDAMKEIAHGWNELKDKGERMVNSIKTTISEMVYEAKLEAAKAAEIIAESPSITKRWITENKKSLTEIANELIKKGKKIGKVILRGIGELTLAPIVITYLLFEGSYKLIVFAHKNTTAKIPELYKLGLTAIQERSEKIKAEYEAGIENFKKEYNGVSESFRYLKRFNDFY
jgi:hypothetical protein